jgi:hypothetical protein
MRILASMFWWFAGIYAADFPLLCWLARTPSALANAASGDEESVGQVTD